MIDFVQASYDRLGLDLHASERDVKRAYAKSLKQIDQAEDPSAFAQLRRDYELAIEYAKTRLEERTDVPELLPAVEASHTTSPEITGLEPFGAENDEANEDAERPSEGESIVSTVSIDQIVASIVASLATTVGETGSGDLDACAFALRNALASEDLISFEARDVFECALIVALARRQFGRASGPMLVAAADSFDWRLGQVDALKRTGEFGHYIEQLLDEEGLLASTEIKAWFNLRLDPEAGDLPEIIGKIELLKNTCPQLYAFSHADSVEPNLARSDSKDESASGGRSDDRNTESDVSTWQVLWRVLLGLVWLPLLLGLIIYVIATGRDYASDKHTEYQPPQQGSGCTSLYQGMARQNWRNVPLLSISLLKDCANKELPRSCSYRHELTSLIEDAEKLYPYIYGDHNLDVAFNLVFHTDTGLSYALNSSGSCEATLSFVSNSDWANFGDERAAEALIARASKCDDGFVGSAMKRQLDQQKDSLSKPLAKSDNAQAKIHFGESKVFIRKEAAVGNNVSMVGCSPDAVVP